MDGEGPAVTEGCKDSPAYVQIGKGFTPQKTRCFWARGEPRDSTNPRHWLQSLGKAALCSFDQARAVPPFPARSRWTCEALVNLPRDSRTFYSAPCVANHHRVVDLLFYQR